MGRRFHPCHAVPNALAKYDLLIVGGGPAGLAAAIEARRTGLRVLLVDERPTLGGQIFKQPGFLVRDHHGLGRDHERGRSLIAEVERSGAEIRLRTTCVALGAGEAVLVEDGLPARTVRARHVLLAPGAHDRPVVFPGWTLPGVITAGGAQTLVKSHRVSLGTRVLFAGSGPLALAFPAQLRRYGASVIAVLEAGPPPRVRDAIRLARAVRGNARLLVDALGYRTELARGRVPVRYRRIVVRAEGDDRVERVTHAAVDGDWRVIPGTEETTAVDTLCIGYGFVPSIELMRLVGCRFRFDEDLGGHVVVVDEWMRTTVPGVSAAGDCTGVEGSYVAEDEGRLAVLGITEDERRAGPVRRRLAQKRRFRRALLPLHRVGPGIFELATRDTVICRCEELTLADLEPVLSATTDVNVIKGLTRAGMGLCQGRNCQRHVAALVAARHSRDVSEIDLPTARMPVRPVLLGSVADETVEDEGLFVAT